MPATPATRILDAAGVRWVGRAYAHDPSVTAFGLEAAAALGVPAERVFKTLMADADGEIVVAIVPVAGRLDLGALAALFGAKRAVLAERVVAERRTGYVSGGISPLGQRNAHRTAIDATAMSLDTVFVSGGRRGFDVELSPADLVSITRATIGAIGAP
ncbi:Cys-tRNA(Pro) deacylase [Labedella endophytica]|uniref:Cys-tRNA(Pro) deacylase n=1 Tax=Labedella endophytica TaxID=1523160 RepID=UPI001FB67EF2|nr:Cys-tRNA(Pro) deacylase [Labedella endophytica]